MASIPWDKLQEAAGEAGFEALPAGEYDVVVETAEAKQTSTGKDQIAVRLKVETGPNAGKSLFNNFVISPENANALAFFFRHMAALGLNKQFFSTGPALDAVAAALVGKRCRVMVSIRQWQGQDRNQVDQVKPAIGPSMAPSPGLPPGGMGQFQQASPTPSPYPTPGNGMPPAPEVPF